MAESSFTRKGLEMYFLLFQIITSRSNCAQKRKQERITGQTLRTPIHVVLFTFTNMTDGMFGLQRVYCLSYFMFPENLIKRWHSCIGIKGKLKQPSALCTVSLIDDNQLAGTAV